MEYSKIRTLLFVFLALACTISYSCKSSSYSGQNDQAAVKDTVSQTDINESEEDLMTVDYKQFYDELAPHGEWIEVTSKDLKTDEKPTSGGEQSDELNEILKDRSSSFPKVTIGSLFGISDAVAADLNVGTFFVWRPDPSMAVSISAGVPVVANEPPVVDPVPMYRPYTNGQWVATNEGWYFKAPTPQEEIVHHYGRWAYSPAMGWVWVPGRVRSPAWVDWREDDDYVAWTPVPPEVYIVNNVINPVPVYEDRYVVVEKKYFVEPVVTQYVYVDKIKVRGMKKLKGIYVQDRVIVNQGPQFVEIERFTGKPIQQYRVVTLNNDFKNTWIENNTITTFAPVFTKVKGNKNRNVVVTQPEKFNKFEEVWNRENRNKSAGNNKVEDIGKQKESKEMKEADKQIDKQNKKIEKQNEKQKKVFDDSDMKTGKKPNKEKNKEKIEKRDKGNENKDKINMPNKEKPRKEVKEKKENPNKDVNREKGNPKKDKKEPSGKQERQKDNNGNSSKGNQHDKPKKDKR